MLIRVQVRGLGSVVDSTSVECLISKPPLPGAASTATAASAANNAAARRGRARVLPPRLAAAPAVEVAVMSAVAPSFIVPYSRSLFRAQLPTVLSVNHWKLAVMLRVYDLTEAKAV
jgi:hypothetical protein